MDRTVSILILLDYLFLLGMDPTAVDSIVGSQSLFYWIIYSYSLKEYGENESILVSILILLDYLFL